MIGRPNVGKSTLLDKLVGIKLAAISRRPQTTRHKITGILTEKDFQMIFLDTPGIIKNPGTAIHKHMLNTALSSLKDADVALFMTVPDEPGGTDIYIIEQLKAFKKNTILAINKSDTVNKKSLLPIIEQYSNLYNFKEIFPTSVTLGINIAELINAISKYLPIGNFFYPEEVVTDKTERFLVEEIIREKLYMFYGQEIPYSSAVKVEHFIENQGENRKDYIKAVIYVERSSQKPIIIGKKGEAIKKLGTYARRDIEEQLQRPVFLEIHVKVMENWRKNERFLNSLGI